MTLPDWYRLGMYYNMIDMSSSPGITLIDYCFQPRTLLTPTLSEAKSWSRRLLDTCFNYARDPGELYSLATGYRHHHEAF
jgi:hypothetical protein